MKRKYRIWFKKSGIRFSPEYRTTLKAAMKLASSRGWGDENDSWCCKPIEAKVFEPVGWAGWRLVATITAAGVKLEPKQENAK